MIKVNEIFYGLQGEGSLAGYPFSFVRLTGCNLRCSYCDTPEAFEEGEDRTVDQIMAELDRFNCPRVLITGGEPLLQPDTPHLIRRLIDEDYEVHLETNGSLDIQPVPDQCRILMDIKCPGSGESDKNHMNNLLHLRPGIELKFVVSNKSDYEWARDFCEGRGLFAMNRTIHFSLVHGKLDPKKLTKWMLKDRVNARLHLQLHKVVWGPSGKEKG